MDARARPPGLYLITLLVLFSALWLALAVRPTDRGAWMMENVLTIVAIVVLVSTYRVFPLSKISYTLIAIFLTLHTVGAHYTYSLVPARDYLGWLPGFGAVADGDTPARNNYDRFVHFSYGLLIAYPIREMFRRVVAVGGFWGYFLPLDLTLSTSLIYELLEWAVVEVFGGDLGIAFLGVQGDLWDAQKDMLLAGTGATIALSLTALINMALQPDFVQDWIDSLRVKQSEPLGERALVRMWRRARRGGRTAKET